jgi:hypothetical protein
VIALSRDYPSIFGAPVLRTLDPAIFNYRYFTHCMSCTFCADSCCSYGVDIDVENIARVNALGDDFAAYIGVPRARWFTKTTWKDPEFPGGAHGRTRTKDSACVFLDRKKRGCKIHAYALTKSIDYHQLKPLVSVLFPLTFEEGSLVASAEIADGSLICAGDGPCLYDGVRGELAHYFGGDFVAEVDSIRTRLPAAQPAS